MADTHSQTNGWRTPQGVVYPGAPGRTARKAPPPARFGETLVPPQKIASDEQIPDGPVHPLPAEARDLAQVDTAAKERVPEQVARRYHILRCAPPDSYLEVATANPFDLDAEKALAFDRP